MRKKILYFLITLFGATTLVSGYLLHEEVQSSKFKVQKNVEDIAKIAEIKNEQNEIKSVTSYTLQVTPTTNTSPPPTPSSNTPPETIPEKKYEVTVTLEINGNNLAIPYFNNMTTEDAMKEATKRYPDKFSYSGITYGEGLGTFVEEINGIRENYKEKMHWILYINGKKSNKGISILILKPDDIIMWNYEKEIL